MIPRMYKKKLFIDNGVTHFLFRFIQYLIQSDSSYIMENIFLDYSMTLKAVIYYCLFKIPSVADMALKENFYYALYVCWASCWIYEFLMKLLYLSLGQIKWTKRFRSCNIWQISWIVKEEWNLGSKSFELLFGNFVIIDFNIVLLKP